RFAQAFADRFPGRVYRVGYFTPPIAQRRSVEPMNVDHEARYVSVWRTRAIDATLERFRTRSVVLPPLRLLPADYAAHLGALVRRVEEAAGGGVRVDYVRTGPDDYAHAEVYLLAAIELIWWHAGLELAIGQGLVPLELEAGDDDADSSSFGDTPTYRS